MENVWEIGEVLRVIVYRLVYGKREGIDIVERGEKGRKKAQ